MPTKHIEVSVSMARYSSNVEPYSGYRIDVADKASGLTIVSVDLSPEEAFKAMTACMAFGSAEVWPGSDHLYGRKRLTKSCVIQLPKGMWGDEASEFACTKALEQNPGWECNRYDRKWNHHRRTGQSGYMVQLFKYED